ncbi:MAG: head maturation protease, ClpP-related [Gammaproteobacteria bacterium]
MKNWYKIKNLAANAASISIHDEIGNDGISASAFINELRSLGGVSEIELHIHSPGGNLLDGLAIYNALRNHPAKVMAHVDGIAASSASIVLMAGDRISMAEDSFIMIHNAMGGAYGGSQDLRAMADTMDKLQSSAVDIYQRRTGLARETISDMMNTETWLSATEAQALGFCEEVIGRVALAAKLARFDLKSWPLNEPDFNDVQNARDFERVLRDLGLSKSQAATMTAKAKSISNAHDDDAALIDRLGRLSAKLQKPLI